ncbi:MAG: hypothetical protein ACI4M4_05325, partial [Candidatus Ornithospirochaeta sp.]
MKSFLQRLQENDADTPITKSYVENTGLGSASITLFIVKNNTVDIKSRNPILPKYQSIISQQVQKLYTEASLGTSR